MDKNSATLLFDSYARTDSAADLSFRQIDSVVFDLMKLNSADVDDVARIVKEQFPNMFRPTPQSGKSTQQQQSPQEQKQILAQFLEKDYAAKVAPNAVQLVDQNGKIVSKINFNAFAAAVKSETTYGAGKHPVRHDILSEIVLRLDQAGLLEHHPQVVERIIEVEKPVPLTRREEAKQNFNLDKLMNAPGADAIKGIGEQEAQKPVVSQAQLEAQAQHDLNENAVMGDVRSVISGHTHSGSHAATKYEREILTNVMNDGIRQNLSAEKILDRVKTKQNSMAKWSTQQGLKELRPELFTSQPKAAGY